MKKITRRKFLVDAGVTAAALPVVSLAKTAPYFASEPLLLWYDKPAQEWTEALPIGNGRLGAMIFGGPAGVQQPDEAHLVTSGCLRESTADYRIGEDRQD